MVVAGVIICLLSFVFGCTTAKISGTGEVPLILNQPQAKIETIQKFEHSKMIVFDYTAAFDVSEVINEILIGTDADAIINLRITVKTNLADFAVNFLTLGLAQSKHFVVSGTAIRAPEGLSALPGEQVETLAQSSEISDFVTFVQKDVPGTDVAIICNSLEDQGDIFRLIRYREQP